MFSKKEKPFLIPRFKRLKVSIHYLVAFGGFIGFIRFMPGTLASLLAFVVYYFGLSHLSPLLVLGFGTVLFFYGIYVSGVTTKYLEVEDYGGIVIDEIVACWLLLAGAHFFFPSLIVHLNDYIVLFCLFRIFDGLKLWPVSWIEVMFKGALGVMIDDVAAALITLLFWYFTKTVGIDYSLFLNIGSLFG